MWLFTDKLFQWLEYWFSIDGLARLKWNLNSSHEILHTVLHSDLQYELVINQQFLFQEKLSALHTAKTDRLESQLEHTRYAA